MSTTKAKNVYSIIAAGLFILIAAGSAKVNKIHCGAFSYAPSAEERSEKRNYVEMHDGTKVFGDDVSWKTGFLVKDQIRIDDQKFPIKDTRGYFSKGTYHIRFGSSYAKRIVHGKKLNVYYKEELITTTTTSPNGGVRTSTRVACFHYVQVGEKGELTPIANQKDIMEFVKDCPTSVEMIDKKNKAIRRSIRKDRLYLNNIFNIYNNDCK